MCLKERSEMPLGAIAAYEQHHKGINRRILDRVASDPEFKKRLIENPRQALEEAGIVQELEALGIPDIAGHDHDHGEAAAEQRWSVCCDYYSGYWHE
jgi:2-polyprenyl-6-methoxyphenol hydroxylase-like FAD-dependent oxidoreductase